MALTGVFRSQGNDSLPRRSATAIVGIPLLLFFIWAGPAWVLLLAVAATILGLLEFFTLSAIRRVWLQRLPSIVLGLLLIVAGWIQQTTLLATLALLAPIALLASHRLASESLRPWLLTVVGPLYLGATLAHAILLRQSDYGTAWLLLAIFATFAVDTSAYFVGRAIGRHRLAPSISPGKTWEGAGAGLLAGLIATVALAWAFELPLTLWKGVLVGAAIGIIGQLGDLLESALKRAGKAKEAGSLVLGHGGILDRLDSIMFNLVVVYHLVNW